MATTAVNKIMPENLAITQTVWAPIEMSMINSFWAVAISRKGQTLECWFDL